MRRRRFFFVEPSKVGSQHITLLEGYLRALLGNAHLQQLCDLVFYSSRSTFASIAADIREQITHSPLPVMNPEKRRLFRKTLLEFVVVLRFLLTKRSADVLFVSCVLPTTLLMLEAANTVLRRRGVFVSLHGEIEGLFDESLQGFRSYGYWIVQWLRLRRRRSTLSLVVIDDFIKRQLVAAYPAKLTAENIFVLHHPILPMSVPAGANAVENSVCFIGYKTRAKGFDRYQQLSARLPDVSFLAIGGGKIEDLHAQSAVAIAGSETYLREIARCAAAVFPYTSGYVCSLSAAAVDALSVGVHIVATDRPCFVSLRERFGEDFVTICASIDEAAVLFAEPQWLAARRSGQRRRIAQLAESPYGLAAVGRSFNSLFPAISAG